MLQGPILPNELFKNIFQWLFYPDKMQWRGVSTFFSNLFAENATLLTTTDIKNAAALIRKYDSNPRYLGMDDSIINFYATLLPLHNSRNHVKIKFTSKWWDSSTQSACEPDKLQAISIEQVALFAFLNTQYTDLATREERARFINIYRSLPSDRPRTDYLREQTIASLRRLVESFSRYENQQVFGDLKEEVRQLINEKNNARLALSTRFGV